MPFRLSSGPARTLRWLGDNGAAHSYTDYKLPRDGRTKVILASGINRLRAGGFLKKDGKRVLFTDKGRIAYFKLKIEACGPLSNNEICLVAFDVPEKERQLRKFIRVFLDSLGFFPIQKSVWISTLDVTEELNEYFCAIGLDDKIVAFTARK